MLEKFEELHRVKRPERFGPNAIGWFFHQDNAPVRIRLTDIPDIDTMIPSHIGDITFWASLLSVVSQVSLRFQAHTSNDTKTWLEVSGYNLIPHAPYSPDLAVRTFSNLVFLDKSIKGIITSLAL